MCKFSEVNLAPLPAAQVAENEPTKSGLERAAGIKPMILADTKRYEGFRQVRDIHKYFD